MTINKKIFAVSYSKNCNNANPRLAEAMSSFGKVLSEGEPKQYSGTAPYRSAYLTEEDYRKQHKGGVALIFETEKYGTDIEAFKKKLYMISDTIYNIEEIGEYEVFEAYL